MEALIPVGTLISEVGVGIALVVLFVVHLLRTYRDSTTTDRALAHLQESMGQMQAIIDQLRQSLDTADGRNRALTGEMNEASVIRQQLIADLAESAKERHDLSKQVATMSTCLKKLTVENQGLRDEVAHLRAENQAFREQIAHLTQIVERRETKGSAPEGRERRHN